MRKDIIVLYKSAYGFTKKYAEWIAEDLNCDYIDINSFDFNKNYRTIIFGGGLYAGKINGIKKLVKNFNKIKNKNIIVFTVGVADVSDAENVKNIISSAKKQIPGEMFSKIKLFHFRGGKMCIRDRFIAVITPVLLYAVLDTDVAVIFFIAWLSIVIVTLSPTLKS